MGITSKSVDYLVVDTTAFIRNAPLQDIAENVITCSEVINEISSKKQLRRLAVLPYNLVVKDVFPENIKIVTDFAKKTGDYPSLSATDIKVMALTYQLEKEKVGIGHLRKEPVVQKSITTSLNSPPDMTPDITGFVYPKNSKTDITLQDKVTPLDSVDEHLTTQFKSLKCIDTNTGDILGAETGNVEENIIEEFSSDHSEEEGWITPSNVQIAKKQINSKLTDDNHVVVACMTTDFAMQNVLKHFNLSVASLDGRIIKQLRTYILRCYTCFKTTSIMTKMFCSKCGNNTLKKVAASLDDNGKLQIHINIKRPLTARGKKFSLPRVKGGKHPSNPILVEDQLNPDNKPSRLARTKNNPLDDDYIAGFSPFVMRDVNSKSAQLCIRPDQGLKYWLKKNPNESRRKRK